MLPLTDLGSLVKPVTAAEPINATITLGDARLQGLSRLDQFVIGQQLQAKVVSLFQDGSALVRIGETAARMTLPANAQPGMSVLLTLTAKGARPTFTMQLEADAPPPLALSAAARQAATAVPSSLANTVITAAPSTPASATISLSPTGLLIGHLLQADDGNNAIAGSLPGLAKLATQPTAQIASALRESINSSGVFYESHIAAWAEGKYALADLVREPQAKSGAALSADGALLTAPEAVNTELGKIINMQLNALDQQRIVWHGEVWPGQNMEWDIHKEPNQTRQQNDATPPSWHSVVRFNFAHLGAVAASIHLVGTQIHMKIRTDNATSNAALRLHGSELRAAMEAAGIALDSLSVKHDGPP